MPHLLKPRSLKKGSRIGVVSPARHPPQDWLDKGKAALESLGLEVVMHPQNLRQDFQLAGSDRERAEAINSFFADPSIDAIICARGGIGSYRTVNYLDFDVIAKNPKIFCGFSDITTLLAAMHKRTGLVGIHGPMLISFTELGHPDNIRHFADMLMNGKTTLPDGKASVLRQGTAEGRLVGGNITLLQHLIGTPDDWDTKGAILFLEDDSGERVCDIDRKFWHFRKAGKFDGIAGLVIGDFEGFRDDPSGEWKYSVKAMIEELVPDNIPILLDLPVAHGPVIAPLPLGVKARLDTSAKDGFLRLLESPFA
jgi:muramoyltetrapeptide carboxypeptidase